MRSVERVAAILRAVAASQNGLSVQEISQLVELPIGSAHRLAQALVEQGLLIRSPLNRRFMISVDLYRIGISGLGNTTLADVARPHLERLRKATGETAFASQLTGHTVVCAAIEESHRPLHLFVQVGEIMPPHAASSARAILAELGDEDARAILERHALDRFTAKTPSTVQMVLAHLAQVRQRGYDLCEDELDHNVWAVSVPITHPETGLRASISVASPDRGRQERELQRDAVALLRQEAAELLAKIAEGSESSMSPNSRVGTAGPQWGQPRARSAARALSSSAGEKPAWAWPQTGDPASH